MGGRRRSGFQWQEGHVHEAEVAGTGDLNGGCGSASAVDGRPAAEGDGPFRRVPTGVGCHAGLDGVVGVGVELVVRRNHLEHRARKPDPADLGPQRTVEIHGGGAASIIPAPLQGGCAAE
jgi:hypothetical protein